MNKCEKCGFLHYRTDPCRNPVAGSSSGRTAPFDGVKVGSNPTPAPIQKPKRKRAKDTRKGDRHSPGYMAKYLREYRARRRSQAKE